MNTHTTSTRQRNRHIKAAAIGGFTVLLVAVAFAVAMFAGGGGTSATANGMDMRGMAMPKTAVQGGTPVATSDVRIKNFSFGPAAITVRVGATVVWTNNDSVDHDVTFDGGAIASSTLGHNDTFAHTFTTAGTYHYICSIHPFMHGTVIVTG